MTQPTRLTLSDDSVIEFPVRLCPAYQRAIQDSGFFWDRNQVTALRDIDDVREIIQALTTEPECTGEGDTAADDLLRLCQRINHAYVQQYTY